MANPSVPEPAGERKVREDWITALGDAQTRRSAHADTYRLLTAPEIRSAAEDIVPLLVEPGGSESPPVYRAIAKLVTQCHPTVLALMLAGAPPASETKRWWQVWR